MIRAISDLLLELRNEWAKRADAAEISHAPTIGEMYEGISRDLLARAIPADLELQLTSGFIVDDLGEMSGQIDCMLVRGKGEEVPFTTHHKWHIKDVVAVLEIKKTPNGAAIADAFDHLRKVRDLELSYISTAGADVAIVPKSSFRVFSQVTGLVAPPRHETSSLDPLHKAIYYTLLQEQFGAVRIVLGFGGYRTELGFRNALWSFLEKRVRTDGHGPVSFPHLIVSGQHSLVKANGQPYATKIVDGAWPFYMSTTANPFQMILELIWTKLDREYGLGAIAWGEDLIEEVLHPYILGRLTEVDDTQYWAYEYVHLSAARLSELGDQADWSPVYLSRHQHIAITLLGACGAIRLDDPDQVNQLTELGIVIEELAEDLVATGLVARSGSELRLTTWELATAFLPTGQIVAGENNTGRLIRWVQRQAQKGAR